MHFSMTTNVKYTVAVPDTDGGGSVTQTWWEAPCADTTCLSRG